VWTVLYQANEGIGPMKHLTAFALITVALIASACATTAGDNQPGPLLIQEQGSFAVGGTVITAPGTFDPIKQGSYNPAGPDSTGQTLTRLRGADVARRSRFCVL
jgi:hypothetical protein